MSEPDLIARIKDEQARGLTHAGMFTLSEILTTLEASDADTVRVQALEQAAAVVDDHGTTWGLSYRSMTDQLSRAIRALTASHPKPEPVETQPEACRSPVTEELPWGPPILTQGRPEWLNDDDMTTDRKRPYSPRGNWPDPALNWCRAADVQAWENVISFRLPFDHPYYATDTHPVAGAGE